MSTSPPTASKAKGAKGKKKSFWQMDIGGKKNTDFTDEEVEHPPFVATLPRVNLLPASITQSIGLGRARRYLIALGVVIVVLLGGLWYMQGSRIADSEARLATAQAEGRDLQGQLEALNPITVLTTALAGQKALVEATLASQPQASVVLDGLASAGRKAGGNDITFSSESVTYQGIPSGKPLNSCPNPDPFGSEITVGCITFNATAADRQQVSRLLEVMDADPLFVGPYVTNTSVGTADTGKGTSITFSGTAGVSIEGLKTVLTPEQVEAIVNPPEPKSTKEKGQEEQ